MGEALFVYAVKGWVAYLTCIWVGQIVIRKFAFSSIQSIN